MDWQPLQTSVPGEYSTSFLQQGALNGFALRQPGVDTRVDRALAVERLTPLHQIFQREIGLRDYSLCQAEQVHGDSVAILTEPSQRMSPGADALITQHPAIALGIYVADCCAVFVLDPKKRVIGLAHSGAKGTRLGIVPRMLESMQGHFGCNPADLTVALSPCIRPPFYEVDFAETIRSQCRDFGVASLSDAGLCTAAHVDRYYSYRREMGKTGRMLALLGLR
jgi:copper oxidase (laccase) domain-containing protein